MIKTKYIILCILVLIFILHIYLIILYNIFAIDTNNNDNKRIYKKILYSNIKKYLKTGDLLFFNFKDANIKYRTFSNNRFSHVGMVYNYNDTFYVIELVNSDLIEPKNKKTISNANLTILEDRIKYYSGDVYYSSLIKPLSQSQIYTLDKILNKQYFTSHWFLNLIF